MNSKIYLLLILFLFTSIPFFLYGQKQVIPGYQGKRILIGGYYNFFSATSGPNANGKSLERDYRDLDESTQALALSGRLDLNASYVINRRITGTFSVGFGQTSIIENVLINAATSAESRNYGLFKIGYSFAAIGIQMNRKKKWGIAPIGSYWGIRYIATKSHQPRLLLTSTNSYFNFMPIDQCDCTWEEIPPFNPDHSIHTSTLLHDVEIQFGIRNIIKKNYFYDMALTTVPLGWYADGYDTWHPFNTKLRSLYAINLRIGLGMLF